MAFSGGADQCAAIDVDEIVKRRGDLPQHMIFDEYGEPVLAPRGRSTDPTLMSPGNVSSDLVDNMKTLLQAC